MDQQFSFLTKIAPEPSNLIKGLQAIQATEGYVSNDAINAAAEYFGIPAVEVEGVLSFYAQFKRVKPGNIKSPSVTELPVISKVPLRCTNG